MAIKSPLPYILVSNEDDDRVILSVVEGSFHLIDPEINSG